MITNRNNGKTTRIANFAVSQLLEIGESIVTDHVFLEYATGRRSGKQETLMLLYNKIRDLYNYSTNGDLNRGQNKLTYKILPIQGTNILMLHVKLEKNNARDYEEVDWIRIRHK